MAEEKREADAIREVLERQRFLRGAAKGSEVPTPLVHSTLLEMIGLADADLCMACCRPLYAWKTDIPAGESGCVIGECSFHPVPDRAQTPADAGEALRWKQRTQILTLARKYLSGELGKNTNLCDVQDATAGEG